MDLEVHPFLFRLITFVLTLFWGSWICLGVFIRIITSPRKFFSAKDYSVAPQWLQNDKRYIHGKVSFFTPDQQHLEIAYASCGKKGNPLMLLLHGFPECWYSWRYQLQEFQDKYWVVAIDTRGYGGSSKPKNKENYSLTYLVEDVAAVIKGLGYDKAVVVGHDWGGAMSWAFADKYPDMCEQVIILNCPHPNAQAKAFRSNIKQLLASWYMFYFLLPFIPEIVMKSNDYAMLAATFRGKKGGVKSRENFSREDLDVFKHSLSTWDARRSAHNYIRANLKYKGPFSRGKITPQMLLIWGTADLFLRKGLAQASMSYASNIQVKYVEGASHWVQQDSPEVVNKYIREFLQLNY